MKEQQTPEVAPTMSAPANNASGNKWLLAIIAFLIGLILGIVGMSLFNTGYEEKKTDAKPTTTVEETAPTPTTETAALTKKCSTKSITPVIMIPESWNCKADELGGGQYHIIITGDGFELNITNLGRGYGCIPGVGDPLPGCTEEAFYAGNAVSLTVIKQDGDVQELVGLVSDAAGVKHSMFITYDDMPNELTTDQKDLLFSVLDAVKKK